ncbi:SPOR domain-containing protein [Iodobacter fluviatilis]|uniref:Sporulation related domain n=1 Tax=Iodobacter fluviatilis TaxID=537 RepID=A0A377Q3Z1_9NEIS|nr:SPOR domain-containing protein [Iodobacter fluviatilis]TCU90393.1 sporulation related protein [Iodobacter fluviatilis]STQ89420.1 Sporulation related domain [Iodobacter fluviatilis]
MKWFFALLLAANLMLWGYPSRPVAAPRLNAEINADKVKLIASLPVQVVNRPAPPIEVHEVAVASAAIAKPTPTPAPTPPPTPAPKAEIVTACMRWNGIGQEQTDTMRARLKALGISSTETVVSGKVWVYIPPQTDIELAKKKAQQLNDQGVQDYYVINNGGRWQNAISLGVFSSREGADRRLNELKEQGVKSAVVRERDDSPSHVTFALRKVSADQQQKLEKLNSQLKGAQLQQSKCS